jgi:hypothetical protein
VEIKSATIGSFVLFSLAALGATGAMAQTRSSTGQRPAPAPTPQVVVPKEAQPAPVAKESEFACGGYLKYEPGQVAVQIVGGEQEQEQNIYSQGNHIFISSGRQQGITVGQEFSIIRPRGRFKSHWSKKGNLGVFTQELGKLKVVSVKDNSSVAVIEESCETVLLGDLVVPLTGRTSPVVTLSDHLDRFSDPSGKQSGRIVLTRDGVDMSSVNTVVYIDLGNEDNIKPGDVFTIVRNPRNARIVTRHEEEISRNASGGYESFRFKGGGFSMQSPRVKDQNGSSRSESVKTPEIKKNRPPVARKVVGELVVINVEQRSATAVITRVAQEVHTGDYVELQ